MYFESRNQAGQMLANELVNKFRYEDCAVVALSDGAVLVGEEIAKSLHCVLTMLLVEKIEIPGEGINFGGISQSGNFTYNGDLSKGEIEDYNGEYHGYLDDQKRQAFQRINSLIGDGGVINKEILRDRAIILVSDGLDDGSVLDVAVDFLKPIRIKRLVVASPIATVQAVDKIHVLADEIHILDVRVNFLDVNHYYNNNEIPTHELTIKKINQIILNWS